MSTDTNDNAPKTSYDSSTAVVSTAHALRLGMPRLGRKVVFLAGDTVIGCEYAKTEDHGKELLSSLQKKHPSAKLSMTMVEARPSSRELRGSTGRPKPYTPAKDKSAKAGKGADAEKGKKKAA